MAQMIPYMYNLQMLHSGLKLYDTSQGLLIYNPSGLMARMANFKSNKNLTRKQRNITKATVSNK